MYHQEVEGLPSTLTVEGVGQLIGYYIEQAEQEMDENLGAYPDEDIEQLRGEISAYRLLLGRMKEDQE